MAKPVAECPDGNERKGSNSTSGIGLRTIAKEFAKKVEGRGKSVILFNNSTIKKVVSVVTPILKKVEYLCNNAIISRVAIPIPPRRFEDNIKYSLNKSARL